MNEQQFLDFLTAFGEEFYYALLPHVPEDLIDSQDAYEMFLKTFRTNPSPEHLAALGPDEREQLRAEYMRYYEVSELPSDAIELWIDRTLLRWPTGDGRVK